MKIRNRYNKNGELITLEEIKNNPPEFPELINFLNELYSKRIQSLIEE